MTLGEFRSAARRAEEVLSDLDRHDAVAAACRGSGNPAALAWLAEACELDESTRLLDLGGGLGGPAAWVEDRYGCAVVMADPVTEAARVARATFGLRGAAATGASLPFADSSFDVCWLLGVVSVVESISAVLGEVARVAPTFGAIAYVSTSAESVESGGSRFPSRAQLHGELRAAGWHLTAGPARPALPPPPTWQNAGQTLDRDDDEQAVACEIADGRIEALVMVGRHRSGSQSAAMLSYSSKSRQG